MAVTQKGAKIKSAWATDFRRRRSMNFMGDATRKQIVYADNDQAMKTIMQDWMFEAPPTPPATGVPMQMLYGMGT